MPQSDEPVFIPAPALPPGPRHALIIATSRYDDVGLRQLRSPVRDAEDFAAVLADPEIGGFTVMTLIDKTEPEIRRALAAFLDGRGTDETILVYLSCHGIQDRRGRLYFAATDTISKYPHASAIRAAELLDELDECRARRQVVILDCCFSGSFADHKGGPNIERQLAGHSRGREVLTASRGFEYSLEGKPAGDEITGSVFTTGLVQGLRSGEADTDKDGHVTVEDAYKYAFRHVQESGADQTPQHWLFGGEGERIILARSVSGRVVVPAQLPEDLANNLESRYPDVRIGAVNAIAEWLADPDPSRNVAAMIVLKEITDNDIKKVARVAASHLERLHSSMNSRPLLDSLGRLRGRDDGRDSGPAGTVAEVSRRPEAVHHLPSESNAVGASDGDLPLKSGPAMPPRLPLALSSQHSSLTFSRNLKEARGASGMTLARLAGKSGVPVDDIIGMEFSTGGILHRETVVKLADALKLEGVERAAFMASAGFR